MGIWIPTSLICIHTRLPWGMTRWSLAAENDTTFCSSSLFDAVDEVIPTLFKN